MPRFFELRRSRALVQERGGGGFDGTHPWGLPGVRCHACGVTWSDVGHDYPCVDLSGLPERREFEKARPEPFAEFARLRELVRHLVPANAELPPGTSFGPLKGRASGRFGSFASQGDILWLVRQDAMEGLQAAGVQGLVGCRPELRFRQKDAPALLELQIEPRGRLHPDCIPPETPPPCETCGRHAFSLPEAPVLDAASLPNDLDLFRVGNFATVVIGSERFMNAVSQLALDGISFRELPTR